MAGQLQTNPLIKTYDEVQRSITRLENYVAMHQNDIPGATLTKTANIITLLREALSQIPEEYRLTRHEQLKREGRA